MIKTIYKNKKIMIKYETGCMHNYLYYHGYKLPLATVTELTYKQARQLVKIIEPALERLFLVAGADSLIKGEEQGRKKIQNDIKKLLGIDEV